MPAVPASPVMASHDPELIHMSASPLLASSQPCPRSHNRHHQPLQPPVTAARPLPSARSSSPRHHTHVSSAASNTSPCSNTSNAGNRGHSSPILASSPPRNRPLSPTFWAAQQLAADAVAARALTEWRAMTAVHDHNTHAAPANAGNADYFIDEIFRQTFASPSTYPPFTNRQHTAPNNEDDIYNDDTAGITQTSECRGRADDRNPDNWPDLLSLELQAGPSAATTQGTDFSLLHDFGNDFPELPAFRDLLDDAGTTQTAATSFSDNMPTTIGTASSHGTPLENTLPPLKRRRGSPTQPLAQTRHTAPITTAAEEEDLFGDLINMAPAAPATQIDGIAEADLTMIDLTEANEVPAELKKPLVDNRTKIAAFQCAICMDDVTGLTVTYCGHLFCAQCLHSSLDVESTKGRCPMCRAKIDMKPRQAYSAKTKGFWPLELKLMTASRKGKRKADAISK